MMTDDALTRALRRLAYDDNRATHDMNAAEKVAVEAERQHADARAAYDASCLHVAGARVQVIVTRAEVRASRARLSSAVCRAERRGWSRERIAAAADLPTSAPVLLDMP